MRQFFEGDRVRVAIQEPEVWADGLAEQINGLSATVEQIREEAPPFNPGRFVFARFDSPPPARYYGTMSGFWFKPEELKPC